MCGICGLIFTDKERKVSQQELLKMSDTLKHRGPDDSGVFLEQNIGMAHRRLSIIDLAGGHQPMFNEDKSIVIVFNGEIYNFLELYKELEERGHHFSTKSDTEVIVHAYEEYGPECVSRLRGMFAFAVWDKRRRLLVLARDRAGKKPLYYYKDESVFMFASEIKAILKSAHVKPGVNIPVLDFYLSLGYTPGNDTLFNGICKLEPAHYMLFHEEGTSEQREYWDIVDVEAIDISFSEAKKRILHMLQESVGLRLISEVPLGVFLSGGLDSSIVVALMSRLGRKSIKTFSVGYKDSPEMSELRFAKTIAEKFNTDHHEFFLSPSDLFGSISTMLDYSEEPIVESAGIALYKLAKLAKPYATVLLSGEGADEFFAGYPLYYTMKRIQRLRSLLAIVPRGLLKKVCFSLADSEKKDKYCEWLLMPFQERYRSVSCGLTDRTREKMYSAAFKKQLTGRFQGYFRRLHSKLDGKSMLRKMLYIDAKSWLAEDILTKSDRMTMAASVEMRCPFLDQELMRFVTSLPDAFKLKGSMGKAILKELSIEFLPRQTVYRKKMGFPVPLSRWFSGALYEDSRKLLLDERTLARGYFNPEYIKSIFANIQSRHDLGKRIFSLVMLELWHRKYID